jgi:ribosome biogenesis GTPase
VVARSRGKYRVLCEGGQELECRLRGRLLAAQAGPVVGDRVRVSAGGGTLELVEERRNLLRRVSEEDPSAAQPIAANIDLLGIVLACEPAPPRWGLADRLLVMAEREGFQPILVLNKCDLLQPGTNAARELESALEIYRGLGFGVCLVSALTGAGKGELLERLAGRISVLSGHSGVGKTSLLNALAPGHGYEVDEVNPITGKGRHTTTLARLVPLPGSGYLVDTPGVREFGLGDVAAAELGRYYPEFRPIIAECRFSDCLHRQEPGCALRPSVGLGKVSNLRYQNYLQILSGLLQRTR